MGIINQISKLHLVKQKKAIKTLNMKEETKKKNIIITKLCVIFLTVRSTH